MKKYNSFLIILIFFSIVVKAQSKWITASDFVSQQEAYISFKKQSNIDIIPKNLIIKIAAETHYWLWINDSLLVRNGGLLHPTCPNCINYDEVNISPYLRKGTNIIAVLLYYSKRISANHIPQLQPLLKMDGFPFNTDCTWKAWTNKSYFKVNDAITNYRHAVLNIGYNASKSTNWQSGDYNDYFTPNAIEVNPSISLIPRTVPMFFYSDLMNFDSLTFQKDTIVASLPNNMQFVPVFEIEAQKSGDTIQVFSETYSLGNKRHHNSIKLFYITKKGLQSFEMPHWISGEKAVMVLNPKIKVRRFEYRKTGLDAFNNAFFSCKNKQLNTLWDKSKRTLDVCTRDVFMDCPDRERTQYAGDVANMMMQCFYAADSQVIQLIKKTLIGLAKWQKTDSIFVMPYGGNFQEEMPLQLLYLTGYQGIYQYLLHSGDINTIRTIYPSIKKYHELWKVQPNGLVLARKNDWYWSDWGTNIDEYTMENMLYAGALKSDAQLALQLGYLSEYEKYTKQYEALKLAIKASLWDGQGFKSPNFKGTYDDRVNALAVVMGIADSTQYSKINNIFKSSVYASPYMERNILEALFQMGYSKEAVERMLLRYNPMIQSKNTTLWELWTYNNPQKTTATYNHGWSAAPAHILPMYIGGLRPTSLGFKSFQIKPDTTFSNALTYAIQSKYGIIHVHSDFEDWQYLLEVQIPKGTEANICIPKKYYKNMLKVNGNVVMNTMNRRNMMYLKLNKINEIKDYYSIILPEGNWLIEVF
ncbi:MAG: alpha-L-rhamnosidase C-terminal domain-containing protein [Bacteroidota bacterium]|nr:alpha-L-rhamnosidase C-terminal domain-containing protein [Bacteroidota bacterium]